MNINKMLKGAVAALTSAAALGALTAPAFAASGTYDLNGKGAVSYTHLTLPTTPYV